MRSLTLVLSLVLTPPALAQIPTWVYHDGTPNPDKGLAVAATTKAVYSAGQTSGGSFGGNIPLGETDIVVIKHKVGQKGEKEQVAQLGTGRSDTCTAIATFSVPAAHQVYIAGHTRGSWEQGVVNQGGEDVFLARLDPDSLMPIWIRQFGTTGNDEAYGIATDPSGNIYVTGHTTGNLSGTNQGDTDAFWAKYDSNGNRLGLGQFGTPKSDEARGVATDAGGNFYIAGHTKGDMAGTGSNQAGSFDLFLSKFDSTGVRQWTHMLGSSLDETVNGVATSRRPTGDPDVYVVGKTAAEDFDFQKNNGGTDAFIVRYDGKGLGKKIWTRLIGTAGNESAIGAASDGGANVYIAGTTNYDLATKIPKENDDFFMVKYDAGGNPKSTRQLGSINPDNEWALNDVSTAVASDPFDGVYVTGYTQGGFTDSPNKGTEDLVVFRYADGCNVNIKGDCGISYGWGDPHLVTFDGLAYDFQGAGEYILAESTNPSLPFVVQARMQPWGTSTKVSVMTAAATYLGVNRVGIYLNATGHSVKVDGTVVTLHEGALLPLSGGGRIRRMDAKSYLLYYPSGDRVIVLVEDTYLNVDLALLSTRKTKVRGLLGNYDQSIHNDLALRTGTVLTPPLTFAELYTGAQSLSSSWRITQQESLFDYIANETTATFTILDFPEDLVGIGSLTTSQREEARLLCLNGGVKDPFFVDSCTLDFALTRDSSFITSAARLEAQVLTQGGEDLPIPQTVASSRAYFANFQSTVGSEWSQTRVTTSPQRGKTSLGTFGNGEVTLSLVNLPRHSTVTVSFDLVIIGTWQGNGPPVLPAPYTPTYWGLRSGTQNLMEYTFANASYTQSFPNQNRPARSGAEANNTLGYSGGDALYRIKRKFNSSTSFLPLTFYTRNSTPQRGEQWALDNVEVLVE